MAYPIYKDRETLTPMERVRYNVEIDFTELDALAYRAAHNKSGKAKQGPVIVKITKRQQRYTNA